MLLRMHNTLPCLCLIRIHTIYLLYYQNINSIYIKGQDRLLLPKPKKYRDIIYRHRPESEKYSDIHFRSYRPALVQNSVEKWKNLPAKQLL